MMPNTSTAWDRPSSVLEPLSATTPASPVAHNDRYGGAVRRVVGAAAGIVAGVLLILSAQLGVAFGTEGRANPEWTMFLWGDHWAWRGVVAVIASYAAGFVGGMVARARGLYVGVAIAVPSVLLWGALAAAGWLGAWPWSGGGTLYLPLGYRIIATVLAVVLVPVAVAGAKLGAAYGRANAAHFDSRRRTVLGIMWYHFLWIPFLIHFMVIAATFGTVYGAQWMVKALQTQVSIFVFIPMMFFMAILRTLGILGNGAQATYEALAGFDDSGKPVASQVFKYGFGYTAGAAAAMFALALVQDLLAKMFG